jgi:glycine C-acetyltransferase
MEKKSHLSFLKQASEELKDKGLFKKEHILTSSQKTEIAVEGHTPPYLNFCANNYLGLSNHKEMIEAAKKGLDQFGFGLSSVRFICGTQSIHKTLEKNISAFLGTEDTILYSSCFDANGGLFETVLGSEDAVISDELNHASVIDGIRLCKAVRYRYKNNDMQDLEDKLVQAQNQRMRLIATDGVFSMDGTFANLPHIIELAEKYHAYVMVDDSHATGFIGNTGQGTAEYFGVQDKVDIYTGTFGKALGGASGGYTSGRQEIIDWLRQRSRPYLFSNSLAPAVTMASLAALDLISNNKGLLEKSKENSAYFREKMTALGFDLIKGSHPIIPIMLYDAQLAQQFASLCFEKGLYVTSFSYPVVPEGRARIRIQISAAHSQEEMDQAVQIFKEVGQTLQVIKSCKQCTH